RPHHDPFRVGVAFHGQLYYVRHGDVVVAAPVGVPFGVGELVHVVAAGLGRQTFGLGVHRRGCVHEVASSAVALDECDLLRTRLPGNDGDEVQPQELGEVGLGHGGGAGTGLDDRGVLGDPAVGQPVQEEGTGEPVFETARRVDGLVLEIEVDTPLRGQGEHVQMGVRGAVRVRHDLAYCPVRPVPGAAAATLHPVRVVRGRLVG